MLYILMGYDFIYLKEMLVILLIRNKITIKKN